MERDELELELERFSAELVDAEIASNVAALRVDALRKIVSGFKGLLDARPGDSQLRVAGVASPPADLDAVEVNGLSAGDVPTGSEAARRVIAEASGTITIAEIIAELERRNWMSTAAVHPHASVRSAVTRLLHDGVIDRVGRGVYRIAAQGQEAMG